MTPDELSGKAQDTGCGISGTLMRTVTNKCIYPLDFKLDDVDINDIAHALAMQCRYNGHSVGHLSVARHSLWVSEKLAEPDWDMWPYHNRKLQLAGLLHDASEAYTGDLIRPLKHRPELAAFLDIEASIEGVIAERFQVDLTDPLIKEADVWVLVHREVNARQWYTGNALQDKAQFLGRFALLGGK